MVDGERAVRLERLMAMQVAVVSSVQTNTTTKMSYANSNWNGNIFAAFK